MSDLIKPNCGIPATGGMMNGYLAANSTNSSGIGFLLFVELWGMTPHMREVAERLAEHGHTAVVCDLFRGKQPPVPEDPLEKWGETFENFDDVRCTNDCRMAANWLKSGASGHNIKQVFPWGFCMGGRFAHNLGAISDSIAGVINFYGRFNFPRMDNKPFLPIDVAGLIDKPYLGIFAETDGLIPPDDISLLRTRLAHNADAEIEVYPGTQHAFFNDHRADVYDAASAERAWEQVMNFVAAHS